jgi:hypothetical protein
MKLQEHFRKCLLQLKGYCHIFFLSFSSFFFITLPVSRLWRIMNLEGSCHGLIKIQSQGDVGKLQNSG